MQRKLTAILALAAAAAVALALPLRASAQSAADDAWKFSLMPYLWLPGVNGTIKYGPPPAGGASANVGVDADKVLDAIDAAFMLEGEARKGRWLIGGDLIYMKLSTSKAGVRSVDFDPGTGPVNVTNATVNAGTNVKIEGSIFTLVGGYELLQKPQATAYAIGGLRYANMDVTTDWSLSATITGPAGSATFPASGSAAKSVDILDAIIGVRGRLRLGDSNWFVPYHLDVGAGDSELTYQAVLGIGHAWRWGDVMLSYRRLYYDQGSDKLLQEFDFSGLALGVNFRF
jgi:hypothetical protein